MRISTSASVRAMVSNSDSSNASRRSASAIYRAATAGSPLARSSWRVMAFDAGYKAAESSYWRASRMSKSALSNRRAALWLAPSRI